MGYAIFTLVILTAAGLGVWRFLRSAGQLLAVRIIDALLPFSVAGVLYLGIGKIAEGPSNPWNECKLAPVVAMTRGYALYQDPQDGVMTAWPYGPVGAIVLLPSALASDPTTCVMMGLTIETICYLAPLFWLLLQQSTPATRPLAWTLLVLIGWITGTHEDLARCAMISGPDGPVICFGALACAALLRKRTIPMMAVSALCAVLCCWTKQNFLPILFALVAWVAIVDGLKKAMVYSGLLAGIGAIVSMILIASFGGSNLYFHMVTIPSSHPWQNIEKGRVIVLSGGFIELISTCALSLALLGAVLVIDNLLARRSATKIKAEMQLADTAYNSGSLNPPATGPIPLPYAPPPTTLAGFQFIRQWISDRPWSLPLLVSIILIPTSVLGYIKVGGFLNHLACTNYFLMIAAAMGLIDVVSRASTIAPLTARIASGIITLFGVAIAFQTVLLPYNIRSLKWHVITHPYEISQQEVYQYALKHPGEVYCPWNNLTTLYADGKLYHFEWGLLDRFYANKMPTVKQFYGHLPEHMNMVVYTIQPQSIACQNALANYQHTAAVPEMKDCIVVVK